MASITITKTHLLCLVFLVGQKLVSNLAGLGLGLKFLLGKKQYLLELLSSGGLKKDGSNHFRGTHWLSWGIGASRWQTPQFLSAWGFSPVCLGVPTTEGAREGTAVEWQSFSDLALKITLRSHTFLAVKQIGPDSIWENTTQRRENVGGGSCWVLVITPPYFHHMSPWYALACFWDHHEGYLYFRQHEEKKKKKSHL